LFQSKQSFDSTTVPLGMVEPDIFGSIFRNRSEARRVGKACRS